MSFKPSKYWLYCYKCSDIVRLFVNLERSCLCGETRGRAPEEFNPIFDPDKSAIMEVVHVHGITNGPEYWTVVMDTKIPETLLVCPCCPIHDFIKEKCGCAPDIRDPSHYCNKHREEYEREE